MKAFIRILSALLALCLIAGLSFYSSAVTVELAVSAVSYETPEELHTVLKFSDGTRQDVSYAVDVLSLDDSEEKLIDSMDVYLSREPILTLGVGNYFSAEFLIPGTTKTVFLAGLSSCETDELQQQIIEAYAKGGRYFSIEDLSFIDAEKRQNQNDGDDNLCWAATASNMLTYTGWAQQAGFSTTDDVFESFINAFTDDGGNVYYGIGWFINGVDTFYRGGSTNVARAKNYGESGAYLTDYCYDALTKNDDLYPSISLFQNAMKALRDGCGVGLSVKVFYESSGSYMGGHAVTMWGYVTDSAYTPDQASYYDMLIISDSDSNELLDQDRRNAKNEYDLYRLTKQGLRVNETTYDTLSYSNGYARAMLYSYTVLTPYSGEVEKETSPYATRNMTDTPDLAVNRCILTNDEDDNGFSTVFEEGDDVYFSPIIRNIGDHPFSGRAEVQWTLKDSTGSVIDNDSFYSAFDLGISYYSYFYNMYLGRLDAGVYTLTMSYNADHSVPEAYYYNNTLSVSFTVGDEEEPTQAPTEAPTQAPTEPPTQKPTETVVSDTYLVGDADGDNTITVLDATLIQRLLADLDPDPDGRRAIRGDVYSDGMTILCATAVQRYLAGLLYGAQTIGSVRTY